MYVYNLGVFHSPHRNKIQTHMLTDNYLVRFSLVLTPDIVHTLTHYK